MMPEVTVKLIKDLAREKLEGMLKVSPILKHIATHLTSLAKEAVRASENIVDIRHTLAEMAQVTRLHQEALERLYALHTHLTQSLMKQQDTFEASKPKVDGNDKPN